MKKVTGVGVSLLFAALALGGSTEKTIPVPKREQSIRINYSSEGAKIESVRIQHYPDEEDVRKAEREKPNDRQLTFWNFSVSNGSDRKVRMKMDVTVIGADGSVVGHGDKTDTVDPRRDDDNIRVWLRLKTLDLVRAKSARLRLSIEPR